MRLRRAVLLGLVVGLAGALVPAWGQDLGLAAPAVALVARARLGRRALPPVSRRIDYGGFLWVELTAEQRQRFDAEGIDYELRPEATLVPLPGRVFRSSDPDAAAEPTASGNEPGFHIVQLAGPLKKAWLPAILGRDLVLVAPLAPYNLIVWGPGAAVQRARRLSFVRWAGPLEPSDRISAQTARSSVMGGRLSVLFFRGTAEKETLSRLESAVGGKARRLGPAGPLLRVLVSAPRQPLGAAARDLVQIPEVLAVQPVAEHGSIRDEMSDQIGADAAPGGQPEPGYGAFLQAKGVDGSGVTVGVVDEGSDIGHAELRHGSPLCLDYTGTIPAPACGSPAPTPCGSHGTQTAGIVLADGSSGVSFPFSSDPDDPMPPEFLKGQGVAPGARLLEQNFLCDSDGGATPPNGNGQLGWLYLSQDQVKNGAYISANSWGPQSTPQGYDADTREFDRMPRDGDPNTTDVAEPVVFVLSIMNGQGGTSTQGTPDEAKNLIRVGATKNRLAGNIDDLCSCTAHGPALDGRMLPDLVAPGELVHSTTPGNGHTSFPWTGTSFASPHVSGAAALLTSWFLHDPALGYRPSPALIKAILVNSADDLFGGLDANGLPLGHRPDSKQGWGRLNLDRAVRPGISTLYFDQVQARTFTQSGQSFQTQAWAQDPDQPLRVSLVWTDAPGAGTGGTSSAWVNDLDLTVSDPNATYLGNVFDGGWSVTGGSADIKNNVENVFLQSPGCGAWQVHVQATNITGDGVYAGAPSTNAADFDQDFALVCHNCVSSRAAACMTPTPSPTLSPTGTPDGTGTPTATPTGGAGPVGSGGGGSALGLMLLLGALGAAAAVRRGRKEEAS
jgi:subtilase family protein